MGSCVGLLIYKLFVGCSLSARVLSGTFYIVYNQQANINILYPLVTMLYKRFKHFFIKTHCIVISCSFSYKMSTFFNLYFSLQNIPIPLPAPKRRQKCYFRFHRCFPLCSTALQSVARNNIWNNEKPTKLVHISNSCLIYSLQEDN